jgi:DNA processing protein
VTSSSGCAAALAALPGIGPAGLVRMLTDHGPEGAWEQVCRGAIRRPEGRGRPQRTWAAAAAGCRPEELAANLAGRDIGVTWWGAPDYPEALKSDPQPPGVLFWRGDLTWLSRQCVALVGTRRATPDGRATAFELGRDLAAAGICVVSGLALGIDGAAHAGALSLDGAGTVGVAASGVDTPYPARHAELWARAIGHGAVCSETPPGQPAQAWRFPARNRVIAGLSRLVVVVESHRAGGSLLTAEAALARGIDVAAVPGPVRSPASEGSNQLLADGPAPVRHAGDILDMLGQVAAWPPRDFHQRPRRPAPARRASSSNRRPLASQPLAAAQTLPSVPGRPLAQAPPATQPSLFGQPPRTDATDGAGATGQPAPANPPPETAPATQDSGPSRDATLSARGRRVLEAVPWRDATLNQIVETAGLSVAEVAAVLDDLEAAGLVASAGSWWRRAKPG